MFRQFIASNQCLKANRYVLRSTALHKEIECYRIDEMDTLEAIRNRRSIRRYTNDAIPRVDLETIVDAGRLAATGNNRQPWDFVVVTNRAMIEQFKIAGSWIEKASAVIVVVMDPVSRWWVEDGSAAIENMLLASTALGYGACWVEGDAMPCEEQFKTLLGVPAEKRVMAVIPVGVAAETPEPKKKPLETVLHWEKY
jgi:nitroreductase